MDSYTNELVMKYLRRNGIVDKFSHSMYIRACEVCYQNYYINEMDKECAARDAIGTVLIEGDMEIPGYEIWVA